MPGTYLLTHLLTYTYYRREHRCRGARTHTGVAALKKRDVHGKKFNILQHIAGEDRCALSLLKCVTDQFKTKGELTDYVNVGHGTDIPHIVVVGVCGVRIAWDVW